MNNIYELFEYVKTNTVEDILTKAIKEQLLLQNITLGENSSFTELMVLFDERGIKPNRLITSRFIFDCVLEIKNNIEDYEWMYETLLADESSRKTLFNILKYRVTLNLDYIKQAFNNAVHQYFDLELIDYSSEEVFVDCGGNNGDSMVGFIKKCPHFKNIYVYEAIPAIYEECERNIRTYFSQEPIILKNNAVLDKKCKISFKEDGESSQISNVGDIEVECVTIDEDIPERVTFIKMDIEGSERLALVGAEKQIKKYAPKLAICVYHLYDDLRVILRLVHSMNPSYKIYLRQHISHAPSETVMYAVDTPRSDASLNGLYGSGDLKTLERIIRNYRNCENASESTERTMSKLLSCQYDVSWYSTQLKGNINIANEQNKVIDELRNWVASLEEGKLWLENQLQNHVKLTAIQVEEIGKLKEKLDEKYKDGNI